MGDTRFRSGSRIWATTIASRLRFVKRASLDHGSSCKKALKNAHQNELSVRDCGVGEIVLQLREPVTGASGAAYVRFWHKADIPVAPSNVRY
jgi:hypothetical protein